MIVGIGTDIVEVERFKKRDTTKSLNQLFTNDEIDYINSRGKFKFQSMAGIYAAKEAFVKAVGTGFVDIKVKDINVLHDKNGQPQINFNLSKCGGSKIFLSISHEKDFAIAYVIIEGDVNERR